MDGDRLDPRFILPTLVQPQSRESQDFLDIASLSILVDFYRRANVLQWQFGSAGCL